MQRELQGAFIKLSIKWGSVQKLMAGAFCFAEEGKGGKEGILSLRPCLSYYGIKD